MEGVIFPKLGVFDGEKCAILVDDFKGHSHKNVKEYVKSFKSVGDDDEYEDGYELVDFHIMGGGITPKSQPIDIFIGKVFKGLYRDHYDLYMLTAPTNSKGQPIIPSCQLCATWVVQAWDELPNALIKKAWEVANYKSMDDIANESNNHELTSYTVSQMNDAILPIVDEQIFQNYVAEDSVYDDIEMVDDNVVS